MCWLQAVPLLQTVFRVEADSLHLTLVGRFLYDVMHFVTEVKDIAAALATPASKAAAAAKQMQCDRTYRPIAEVQRKVSSESAVLSAAKDSMHSCWQQSVCGGCDLCC